MMSVLLIRIQVLGFCQTEGGVGENEKNPIGIDYTLSVPVAVLCMTILSSRKPHGVGTINQVVQVNKLRITELEQFTQSHTCS